MSLVVLSKPKLTTFKHFQGNCYILALPELAPQSDGPFLIQSDMVVREDDKLIGRRALSIDEIVEKGSGAYLHFGDALFFSTSDNTDPNANGRIYEPYLVGYSKGAFSSAPKPLADLPYVDTASHGYVDMRADPKLRDFYDEFQKRNTCKFKGLKNSNDLAALFLRIGQSGSSAALTSIARSMPMYSFGGWRDVGRAMSNYFGQERSQRKSSYKMYDTHNYVPLHPIMESFAQYFTFIRDPRRAFLTHYFWNTTIYKGKYSPTGAHYTFSEWLDVYYESHKGRHRAATLPMSRWFTHLDQPMFTVFEELLAGTFQTDDFEAPFERAMKNSVERFFFIGITEYFDESLFILYLLLDIPEMPLWAYDLRSLKPPASEITLEQQAKIDELIATDMEFYQFWREKFEKEFAVEIAFFKENIKSLRGQYVLANPNPSRGLAEDFFASASTMLASPEMCGPREAVVRFYGQHNRGKINGSGPGNWWPVRSVLDVQNDIAGPDGRLGVLRLLEDRTPAATHDIRLNLVAPLVGRKRVVFAFVKSAGRPCCGLWLYGKDAGARASASFSLEDGEIHSAGAVGGGWSNVKAGTVQMEDGWWWIWLAGETDDPSPPNATLLLSREVDGTVYYDGDGESGVYVFDPRIERELTDWGW